MPCDKLFFVDAVSLASSRPVTEAAFRGEKLSNGFARGLLLLNYHEPGSWGGAGLEENEPGLGPAPPAPTAPASGV